MDELLIALKFPQRFIECVLEGIKTPRFTLLLNGGTEGFFHAKREQGDPMSPLLFVHCMDYLSLLMSYIGEMEMFKDFIGCSNMKLNHLCFDDDLLLFCRVYVNSAHLLLQGLQLFFINFWIASKQF